MNKIKVAFFGSSEFSIPTLKHLIDDELFDVVSVITLPPVVKNRGMKISNNVVYDFAVQNGVAEKNILTPKKLRNNQEIFSFLEQCNLDFIIVVAYGKIIPNEIINLPKFEILNLHPSALPKYRGAAPIERAIENGDKQADICIMKISQELDAGDVATRIPYVIDEKKSAREIVPDVANIGAKLMVDVIKKCYKNGITFVRQDETIPANYAKKIEKSELFIDLNDKNLDAVSVFNKIRAFNNNGCCYFLLENQRVKIIFCELRMCENDKLGFDRKSGYLFFKNGIIKPTILQKEGKKPMALKDFLNGLK